MRLVSGIKAYFDTNTINATHAKCSPSYAGSFSRDIGAAAQNISDQYREFALERDRLAAQAKTEPHRQILKEMAAAWRKLVQEEEEQNYFIPRPELPPKADVASLQDQHAVLTSKR